MAKNIQAELVLSEPFKPSYSGSDVAYLGKLSSSEAQSALFYLDVSENTQPGKYSLSLELDYEDSNGEKFSLKKTVDLFVEPKPYFEIASAYLIPEDLKPGDRAKLFVEIKNIGHENAESADLRVIRESGQPFSYVTRSDFIGTLRPAEKGTAVLEFDVDVDANPKEYLLKLLIRSTGDSELGDTNVYTQELKTPVVVLKAAAAESKSSFPIFTAAAITLALVIGYVFGRKRKS